jgi:hypothetical protein
MNAVSTDIIPFTQLERMAVAAAKSGLFGVKTPDQAIALMLIAQAEGVHPARAMQEYHVIQGRPALKADAMLARYQASGGKVQWKSYTDENVTGIFSHPSGGTLEVEWTTKRASEIKSYNKDSGKWEALTDKLNWQNYPRSMLRARCISEGVRATFPGIATGTYTAEETADMDPRDVTPETPSVEKAIKAAGNPPPPAALTEEEITEHLVAMNAAADQAALAAAFSSAWKHSGDAKDAKARDQFKAHYDQRKATLSQPAEGQPS